jgi:hypothetical protein
VLDRNVALLGTTRRIARHQQDRQAGKQHAGLLGEIEPVNAARYHDAACRGDDDWDVACRLVLPEAEDHSPELVAAQHHVEQNSCRLHALDRTLCGGDVHTTIG